ncbi:MAG: type II toxin-antitoxin system VapC family toxin [Candidatus Saccharimonas sp.]|nr:type II toxin-antitoxin system VapC family toxin [Planctomycetaceae bacterium]
MRPILIDTNAYSAYHRGRPETLDVVQFAPEIAMSVVVLGELGGGFATGSREADNRRELQQFLASPRVRVLEIDSDTAELYAGIFRELRRKGTPIPQNDMWIAASALQHNLALFTFDQHFHSIGGLVVGHTLADFADPGAGESLP